MRLTILEKEPMTEAYTIRRATPADLGIIVSHRRKMFEDMGHGDPAMLKAAEPRYTKWLQERLENGRYLGWLAQTRDGTIVSGAGLWLLDWPAGILDIAPYRGYIFNVYTERTHRRQGLARQLIQAAIGHCSEEGIRVIGLHASKEGRAIYEAMGFEPTNEMRIVLPGIADR